MGNTISVKIVPEAEWSDDDAVGLWNSQNLIIQVRGGLHPHRAQQAFCHELVHAMLDAFSHPISKDEQFVDTLAGLLHQAWTSIESQSAQRKAK